MSLSDRLLVTSERSFSAHHMLISAARVAVDGAKSKRPGWSYDSLVGVTLCALSIEAMCNSIGERVIDDWKDFESAGPNAKLRLLSERLEVDYKKDQEPWKGARWLCRIRNRIAHAKPELIKVEKVLTRTEFDKSPVEFPQSKLEKEITIENAERALWVAESVKEFLCRNIPPDIAQGLYCDSSFGSASAHKESA